MLYCITCLNTKLLSCWLVELPPLAPFSGSLRLFEPLSSPAISELTPSTVECLQDRHQFWLATVWATPVVKYLEYLSRSWHLQWEGKNCILDFFSKVRAKLSLKKQNISQCFRYSHNFFTCSIFRNIAHQCDLITLPAPRHLWSFYFSIPSSYVDSNLVNACS